MPIFDLTLTVVVAGIEQRVVQTIDAPSMEEAIASAKDSVVTQASIIQLAVVKR